MKIVSSVFVMLLLVASAIAQTDAGTSTAKGCLSGSDGNYTLIQEGTGVAFKIAGSAIDLKPHLGHEVELVTEAAGNSGFKVTELRMISEHCTVASKSTPVTMGSNSNPPAMTRKHSMPKTATPLPLLAGLGFGLILSSWFFRRKATAVN